jgi:hypothetical protein
MMHENVVAHYRPKELIFSAKELISHGPTVGRTPILSVSLDRLPVAQKALARRHGNRVRRRMTACGKPERPHWVNSVEKLTVGMIFSSQQFLETMFLSGYCPFFY